MYAAVKQSCTDEELMVLWTDLLAPSTVALQRRRWNALVARLDPIVRASALRVLRRYGVATAQCDIDDHCNDVWVALLASDLRRLRAFSPDRGSSLSRYVARIAANVTIDALRARRLRTVNVEELPEIPCESHESALDDALRLDVARAAMAQLTTREQEFASKYFDEERSPTELAGELGVTVAAIYTRKFRLEQRLQVLARQIQAQAA
jgi:RNA polymerase sigma factor (sigma-70 family)